MTGAELADLAGRVGPVLAFLVAITIVAEIADLAGVFDVAAHWAARAGRQRVWALWLLIVAIACASTIVLSLDTTAVLLTPVAITVARQVGAPASRTTRSCSSWRRSAAWASDRPSSPEWCRRSRPRSLP